SSRLLSMRCADAPDRLSFPTRRSSDLTSLSRCGLFFCALFALAPRAGIEPATYTLEMCRSIHRADEAVIYVLGGSLPLTAGFLPGASKLLLRFLQIG